MNRGRNQDRIYLDDTDAVDFLFTLHNTIDRFGIEIHAYSLMPNHYHLLIRSPLGNVSDAMKHLGATYTQSFNRRHGRDGTLFRGRFKSQLVKKQAYLTYLAAYIHLNPLKAGLITRIDGLNAWTSYRRLLGRDSHPEWLATDEMANRFGSPEKLKELTMKLHRKSEPWPQGMRMDTGWFQWHLCAPHRTQNTASISGSVLPLARLIKDICQITGVDEASLQEAVPGRGGNPARRFAVWALHNTTYLKHAEIGQTLGMSKYQVAKIVERSGKNTVAFRDWDDQWLKKYPKKVSIITA
ncbi:MAG: transposase [Deltaproteobacteria bacterium]|nr:transposase [Deltaproteobacteria bacterium]